MRILIDTARVDSGGALQNCLAILDNAARESRHEWHAVLSPAVAREFPAARDAELASVARIEDRGSLLARLGRARSFLPAIEARLRPDVVYTAFNPALWKARSSPHLLGFAWAHLLYPESPFVRRAKHPAQGRLALRTLAKQWSQLRELRSFDFVVVETETVRRRLREVRGITEAEIFVVRNSCSPSFAALARANEDAPPQDRRSVLVPSDYRPNKNLEIVPAVAEALARRLDAPFEFVLTVPDAAPWRAIAADADRRGVGDRLRNLGPVPHADFAAAYARAHVVYLPTLLECSTAVFPESFMSRRPLVTSDLDFARELCEDAALYCDPYSAEEAAERIARVLLDEELGDRMTERGQEVLARNYPTPEAKWEKLVDCLIRVAGGR